MSTFQYDQNASFAILGDNPLSFGEFQTLKIGNIFNFDILEEVRTRITISSNSSSAKFQVLAKLELQS